MKKKTSYLILFYTWSSLCRLGKVSSEKDQEMKLKSPKKNAKYSQIHIFGFIYPGS